MKKIAAAFGILTIFITTVGLALSVPALRDGFSGIAIPIFLCYCGLIVVAQVGSALFALRKLLGDWHWGRKERASKQIQLR